MKVLLWSPHGAGEHYGGPGTAAFRMYSQPGAADLEVTLAHGFTAQAPHPEVFAAQHLVAPAVKNAVVRVGGFLLPDPVRAVQHAAFLRSAKRFMRARAAEFDVLHGLMAYAQTVRPAVEAERRGLPSVVKVAQQGSELAAQGGLSRLTRRTERRRARLARLHGVIAPSRAIVRDLIRGGMPESVVAYIPNGVDIARFRPAADPREVSALRAELGWRDVPTVLFVGGVVERKRPHLLVDALRHLGSECQLVMVGPVNDAEYFAALRQHILAQGLQDRVVWSKFRSDIERCYRAADLFCLPSRSEGLSNAVLEAMASGLPFVMTDISGAAELSAGDASGIVLSEAEPVAIAEALRFYLDDAEARTRHGCAARCKVEQNFSAERVLNLHRRLFRRLMRGGSPAEVAPW